MWNLLLELLKVMVEVVGEKRAVVILMVAVVCCSGKHHPMDWLMRSS